MIRWLVEENRARLFPISVRSKISKRMGVHSDGTCSSRLDRKIRRMDHDLLLAVPDPRRSQAADWKASAMTETASIGRSASSRLGTTDNNDGLTFIRRIGRVDVGLQHCFGRRTSSTTSAREAIQCGRSPARTIGRPRRATSPCPVLKDDHIVYVRVVATCKGIATTTSTD